MRMLFDPYSGNEPFAYVLCSISDDNISMPFIENTAQRGLRIWFDHNLRTNALEWQQKTKKALNECDVVIAILSNNAIDNHVYRKQLTACIELGKPLFIINIDHPILTIGISKQAERALGSVACSEKVSIDEINSLLEQDVIKKCLGQENPSIVIHDYEEKEDETNTKHEALITNADPSDETVAELGGMSPFEIKVSEQHKTTEDIKEPHILANDTNTYECTVVPTPTAQLDATIVPATPTMDDADATVVLKPASLPAIVSLVTGQFRNGLFSEMTVGRVAASGKGIYADISFPNETAYLARKHFQIIDIDGKHIIKCLSVNGINIDGLKELHQDETCEVGGICVVKAPGKYIANHQEPTKDSSLFIVAFGDSADWIRKSATISAIMSVDTGEIKILSEDTFLLGRNNPWQSKAMTSRTISREHGILRRSDESYSFEQVSNIGSHINTSSIMKGDKYTLQNEDCIMFSGSADIGIADEQFVFFNVSVIK